jgi:hypothetical protein
VLAVQVVVQTEAAAVDLHSLQSPAAAVAMAGTAMLVGTVALVAVGLTAEMELLGKEMMVEKVDNLDRLLITAGLAAVEQVGKAELVILLVVLLSTIWLTAAQVGLVQ